MRRAAAVAALVAAGVPALARAQVAQVHIAPDDHTDYMWSGDEETHRRAFVEMLDHYLDAADATRHLPPAQQSRWNADGSLWVWTYEKDKPRAAFQRLVARLRDGHIGMPLNALVSTYGATPTEAVLRGMYYAGSLERRFGLRFPVAIAMENQTLPLGLGSLWAGAGARYSWKGVCGCATQLDAKEPRQHEVYWWKGLDDSRLLMKWYTLTGDNRGPGGYAEARRLPAAIEALEADLRFGAAHRYDVTGLFGWGWDDLVTTTDAFVVAAKSATTPRRQVIVSNQVDYFRAMEARHGRSLPEATVSFGNEWDLYSASMSELSARVRRSVEKLRAAEAMATVVALRRPELLEGRAAERERAWLNLGSYWEHNWTADGRIISRATRAAWQRRVARRIEGYVDALAADATAALGNLIRGAPGKRRIFVFNALGWRRTEVAETQVWEPGPLHVVDLVTGEQAVSELSAPTGATGDQRARQLRFVARDVPSLGYKVFEVREGAGQPPAGPGPRAEGGVLENERYRLTVAGRGAITSLIDRATGRELAAAVDGRWINDLGPGEGGLTVEHAGPVSATLRATATKPLAHTTRITLYRDSPRIDIQNEITQGFADVRTWGFGFALPEPEVWHEELGAVLRARTSDDGGHYSTRNARLDWLTLNHFVSMTGKGGAGLTLSSSDLAFMKLGRTTHGKGKPARLDTATPALQVLAGGQVDGPTLGIPAQGGDTHFLQRFSLRADARFRAADSMRFALEHQNPLVTGAVLGTGPYPERTWSLLSVSSPDVLVWAVKPAEEGIDRGVILRLWNMTAEAQRIDVAFTPGLSRASRASHIETDLAPLKVSGGRVRETVGRHQLVTWRLSP